MYLQEICQDAYLAEYELSQMKENGTLPEDGALIKTIVTTNLANGIAKYYGVNLIEVLTGFKYIGEQILKFRNNQEKDITVLDLKKAMVA